MTASVPHPGLRIRAELIPKGLSVTDAAKVMGVGRPALSNMLNGKANLSLEMATKLAKAFNTSVESLMAMQSAFEADQARATRPEVGTRVYVSPFLAIKANEITDWADKNITARQRLSVLLRTLVNSTGSGLSLVNFPGNDDSERPGWDGEVHAAEASPWIPLGHSGWEFGVNENAKSKADGDYEKSKVGMAKEAHQDITFVFVTPRRWPGKAKWQSERAAEGFWKDVRVYDASNLEQWLEQSPSAQAWFANETKRLSSLDVRSLDACWSDWSQAAAPALDAGLFQPAVAMFRDLLVKQLKDDPPRPITIGADSTAEGLAFLAQALADASDLPLLAQLRDQVLVFDAPQVLPRLAQGAKPFIAVTASREVERELGPYASTLRSVLVYPRNALASPPDFMLQPVDAQTFKAALSRMGKSEDEIRQLSTASGRSLTVLRRRLAELPALRRPNWADDPVIARRLIPFMFTGAWNRDSEADQELLSEISGGRPYEELEADCQELSLLDDAPVWSIGLARGVVSKLDLLFAIALSMTAADLNRYFQVARQVLAEDDPALDLPEDRRWAAGAHGKRRRYSGALRAGVADTLLILSVHGDALFSTRTGIDIQQQVARLVADLMPTPLTSRTLLSADRDLETYAEAAPDRFLGILEQDLRNQTSELKQLMRPSPVGGILSGTPYRTSLLWALELLCWNPDTFPRATRILAELATIELNDNWGNKPINSLLSVFRAWMPQTAADLDDRINVLKAISKQAPNVGWRICTNQFGVHSQTGHYSHKPKWRSDAVGHGQPLKTRGPVSAFVRSAVEIALAWPTHTIATLGDLLERLIVLSDEHQERVWNLIESWALTAANEADKVAMREKVRTTVLSRRLRLIEKDPERQAKVLAAGKKVFDALEPLDLVQRHAWLFRDHWLEVSAEKSVSPTQINFAEREAKTRELRLKVLQDCLKDGGLETIVELAKTGKAAAVIGHMLAVDLLDPAQLVALVRLVEPLSQAEAQDGRALRQLLNGVLAYGPYSPSPDSYLIDLLAEHSDEARLRLCLLAGFNARTWNAVDGLPEHLRTRYWHEVHPQWAISAAPDRIEGVERLITAGRPAAAFAYIALDLNGTDPLLVYRLLRAIADASQPEPQQPDLEHYQVQEAFKLVNEAPGLSLDQKAALEFAFIDAISSSAHGPDSVGIPNLEVYVDQNPGLFVQAVAWVYGRDDGGEDPLELQATDQNSERARALRGYQLIEGLSKVPGRDEHGAIVPEKIRDWVSVARRGCTELGRSESGDNSLGKLLSNSPVGSDGIWPCEAVREVMEEVGSEEIMSGAQIGVYNSRGVHWRGPDGQQERNLANKYRRWADALRVTHPFVSSRLLKPLVQTYEQEADSHDLDAQIRQRMP